MSKTTKRNIIVILVAVLVAVFVSTLIGSLSNGYEDVLDPSAWGKEVNPDNLIQADEKLLEEYVTAYGEVPSDTDDFYEIKVNSKGVVSIEGENTEEEDHYITLWSSSELAAGTYTFSCEVNGTFEGDVLIGIDTGSAIELREDGKVTLAEGDLLVVQIVLPADEKVDATFMPVLVEGEKEGSFYLD